MAYTHDLGRLLDDCIAVGGALAQLSEACDSLTGFAVVFRYPGDAPDIEEGDGRAAVEDARKIVDAVSRLVDG